MRPLSDVTASTGRPSTGSTLPRVTSWHLFLLPLLVIAVAAVIAGTAGTAAFAIGDATDTGDEGGAGELFFLFIATVVAAAVLMVAMLVGLTLLARRLFVPGRRATAVALALVAPVFAVAAGSMAVAAESRATTPLVVMFAVVGLLAPSMAFLWCGNTLNQEVATPAR